MKYSFSCLEPVHCSMSDSNCCFLTCIQLSQEAGKVAWYSHCFQNFPQFVVIHTVKVFSIVNEAEVDVFLEFSCFFYDPTDVGNLENFEHYFASICNEYNYAVVWTFSGFAFLWDWNENWPFPVLWLLKSFPNLLAYWVQHFHSIIC